MLSRIVAALLAAFGFATLATAETGQVTGTATYRERIALPPGAELHVALVDVSLADAPAVVLSEQILPVAGVPVSFSLPYDPADISDRFSYAVQARIVSGDKLLFINSSRYAVLTNGAGSHVDMVLQSGSAGQTRIFGTDWTVVALGEDPVDLARPPTIRIAGDGSLAVFGGCNRFVGSLADKDGGFAVREGLAGTMMACPENVAKVEDRFLRHLKAARRHSGDGQTLLLMAEDGTVLVRATAGL